MTSTSHTTTQHTTTHKGTGWLLAVSARKRVKSPRRQWMCVLVDRWTNEANKSLNPRFRGWFNDSEPMNQWIHDTVNQWTNWVNGWKKQLKEWMDWRATFPRWASSSLRGLFAEEPLLSATASLSGHLFGLPVLWAPNSSFYAALHPLLIYFSLTSCPHGRYRWISRIAVFTYFSLIYWS